jgi:hypothetical protein
MKNNTTKSRFLPKSLGWDEFSKSDLIISAFLIISFVGATIYTMACCFEA